MVIEQWAVTSLLLKIPYSTSRCLEPGLGVLNAQGCVLLFPGAATSVCVQPQGTLEQSIRHNGKARILLPGATGVRDSGTSIVVPVKFLCAF